MAAGIAALSSCSKEYITQEIIQGPSIQTVQIGVPQSSWGYSYQDNNNYFYATVDMPEITKSILKTGLVKMYRVYDLGSRNEAQMEMPFTRLKEEQVNGGDWVFYTEAVDYEFSEGKITIFYTVSDFNYELDETFVPESMDFRCVILY